MSARAPIVRQARRATPVPSSTTRQQQQSSLQRKFSLGAVGDPLEHEADNVADRALARASSAASLPLSQVIQRFTPGRSRDERGPGVPEGVREVLASPGVSLGSRLREEMEERFTYDFSAVRIHSDPAAARSAREINAEAYTCGTHIAFGAGMFAPSTARGRRLLAHELTHVVQQGPPFPVRQGHSGAGLGKHTAAAAGPATVANSGTIRRKPADPAAIAPERPSTNLSTGMLLDQALTRLEEPDMRWLRDLAVPVNGLWKQLIDDASSSNDAQSEKLRDRADRLNGMLVELSPAITALHQLSDPQKYLPDIAPDIIGEVQLVVGMYAAALISSYSDLLIERDLLKQADGRLAALPDFITAQYLRPEGMRRQLWQIHTAIFNIGELRSAAGRPLVARSSDDHRTPLLDDILKINDPGLQPAQFAFDTDLTRAKRSNVKTEVSSLLARVAVNASMYGNLAKAGLLYEQFTYWSKLLGEHPVLDHFPARKPECDRFVSRLDAIIGDLESGWVLTGDLWARYAQGANNLEQLFASPEFNQILTDVPDRLATIATINRIATVIAITAGAALFAGAAAAGVGAALETEGATLLTGVAKFGTEALAFTAATRLGQEIAFGHAEGTFAGDLLTNALMLGVLKVATLGYTSAFRVLANPNVYRASYAIGKAGVGLATLQIFGEVQTAILTGKAMSGEERYRSIVQNVITLGALEAAGFITKPLQERIGTGIAKAFGLDQRFATELKTLQTHQGELKVAFEALKRSSNPAPGEVQELLKGMQDLWGKELDLLKRGRQRHAITPEQYDEAIKSYADAGARIQLQLANLGFELPGGAGDLSFRRLGQGVVSYAVGSESVIEDFYKEKGGKLERNADGTLQGRLPGGEITFYIAAGEAPKKITSREAIAGARDRAERAALADPLARAGLDRLRELMSARNADEVLAAAGDVEALLHALADPGFKRGLGVAFYQSLAGKPFAIEFARRYGADLFDAIYRTYRRNWTEMPDALRRTGERLDAAATPDARKTLRDQIMVANRTQLGSLLGAPAPQAPAKALRVTKKTLGVNRAVVQWAVLRGEVEKFATSHDEKLNEEQLDERADMAQIRELARQGKYANFSHANRQAILDRFDELAHDTELDQAPANQARGDLAEALFNPNYGKRRAIFLNGVPQSSSVTGATIPDYSIAHTGFTEWVDLKSDRIDTGPTQKDKAFDSGVAAAQRYLEHARADLTNLPAGDKVSLDFIRDPGPTTRRRMLAILFAADSPVYRVRFGGGTWFERGAATANP